MNRVRRRIERERERALFTFGAAGVWWLAGVLNLSLDDDLKILRTPSEGWEKSLSSETSNLFPILTKTEHARRPLAPCPWVTISNEKEIDPKKKFVFSHFSFFLFLAYLQSQSS
jgi:hypothetical protein